MTPRAALGSIATLVALVLMAMLASTAGAVALQGQVVGAAYADGGRIAVPVLLADRSVKAAKLTSPLVRLSLPKTASATSPDGAVPVAKLRIGDAFKIKLSVSKAARKAGYPKLKAPKLQVTKRGSTPSVAELAERLDELTGYVERLAGRTDAEFAEMRAQLTGMRGELGTLDALVGAVQAAIPGLPADPAGALTTLIAQVSTLESRLDSLTEQLGGATAQMTEVSSKLTGVAPGDLVGALTSIGQLETLLGGVDVAGLNTTLATLLGNIGGTNASALTGQLSTLQTALGTATSRLTFLCSSAGLVKGNPLLGLLGLSNLIACP